MISAENLRDYTRGPAETALSANVLKRDSRIGDYVIEQETWDCSKFPPSCFYVSVVPSF